MGFSFVAKSVGDQIIVDFSYLGSNHTMILDKSERKYLIKELNKLLVELEDL